MHNTNMAGGHAQSKSAHSSGKVKPAKKSASKQKSARKASSKDKLDHELMETELSQAKSWLTDRTSKIESEISQLAERLQIRRMLGKTRESREPAFQEDLDSSLRIEGQGSPTRGNAATNAYSSSTNRGDTSASVQRRQNSHETSPVRTSGIVSSPGKNRRGKQTSSSDRSDENKHMSSVALKEIAKQIKDGGIYEKLSSRDLVFKEYTTTNKVSGDKFDSALEKMHVKLEGGKNDSMLLQSLKKRFTTNAVEGTVDYVSFNEALQDELENGQYFAKLKQKGGYGKGKTKPFQSGRSTQQGSGAGDDTKGGASKNRTGSNSPKEHGDKKAGEDIFAEVVQDYMQRFSLSLQSAGQRLFASLDKNKNKALGWSEFKEGLERFGAKVVSYKTEKSSNVTKELTEADVTALFSHFDQDNTGVVGQNQFLQHLQLLVNDKKPKNATSESKTEDHQEEEDSVWSHTWADRKHVEALLKQLGYATEEDIDEWMSRFGNEAGSVLVKDVLDELMAAAGRASEGLREHNVTRLLGLTQCIDGSILELAGRLASHSRSADKARSTKSQLEGLFEDMKDSANALSTSAMREAVKDIMGTPPNEQVISTLCSNWTNRTSTKAVSRTKFMQYFVLLGGEMVKMGRQKLPSRKPEVPQETTPSTEQRDIFDISDRLSVGKGSVSDDDSDDELSFTDFGKHLGFRDTQSLAMTLKSDAAATSWLREYDQPHCETHTTSTYNSRNALRGLRESWEWVASGAEESHSVKEISSDRKTFSKEQFVRYLGSRLKEAVNSGSDKISSYSLADFVQLCTSIDGTVAKERIKGLWKCIVDKCGYSDEPEFLMADELLVGVNGLLPENQSSDDTVSCISKRPSNAAVKLREKVQNCLQNRFEETDRSGSGTRKASYSIGGFSIRLDRDDATKQQILSEFLSIFDTKKDLALSESSREYRISLANFESELQDYMLKSDSRKSSIESIPRLDAHEMLEALVDLNLIRDNYSKVAFEPFLVFCVEKIPGVKIDREASSTVPESNATRTIRKQKNTDDANQPPNKLHHKQLWKRVENIEKQMQKVCKERAKVGGGVSSRSKAATKLLSKSKKPQSKKAERATDLDFRQMFEFFDRSNKGYFTLEELHTTLYETGCIEDPPPNPYPPAPTRLLRPDDPQYGENKDSVIVLYNSSEPHRYRFVPDIDEPNPREGQFKLNSGWVGIEVPDDVAAVRGLFCRIHGTDDSHGTGAIQAGAIVYPRNLKDEDRVKTDYPCLYVVPVTYSKLVSWAAPLSHRLREAKDKITQWLLRKSTVGGGGKDFVRTFERADKDGDGKLSTKEFKQAAKEVIRSLTDEDVHSIIQHFDCDGNGVIEFQEFINMFSGQLASLYQKDPKYDE
eukprot:gb/GECG01016203.1/.p1 GENE.gb/GECG01016203.1/~~gb/GECG01016203.1/.p1  ORF type:complete len:1370 (+),score=245.87 gb/GECG01016203.1/:1-4110(+)